jgi:hypothetical protein
MRSKRNHARTPRPAVGGVGRRVVRGPLTKRCRTCDQPFPVAALRFGRCGECVELVAVPVQGPDGRFISPSSARPVPLLVSVSVAVPVGGECW